MRLFLVFAPACVGVEWQRMGDEIEKFRELVGDEGASVGQIQAHRRVQESTSCPAVFVCLVSTRTESDLNLVPVHAIFRAIPTTFGCANSLFRRRQWPLLGRRKHKRDVAGCGCRDVHGAGLGARGASGPWGRLATLECAFFVAHGHPER